MSDFPLQHWRPKLRQALGLAGCSLSVTIAAIGECRKAITFLSPPTHCEMGSECARLEHPAKRVRSKTNSHRKEIAVRNSQQPQPASAPIARAESPTTPITYPVGRLSNARILRLKQVVTTVGLAKSSIYRKIQIGTFPPPIKLGGARASGWLSTEVLEWIEDQVRRRPKAVRSR